MEPVVVMIGGAVALALVLRPFDGGTSSRRAGRRQGMVDDGDSGGDGGGGDGGGGD